jgi:predicted RNA-binding Zn-ribbon protein involved in translation (DUF1610 family)
MTPSELKLTIVRVVFVAFLASILLLLIMRPSAEASVIVAVAAIFLVPLVKWHARVSSYVCPHCGAKFNITAFISFLSPHVPGKKWLYCPNCNEASWCKRVPR